MRTLLALSFSLILWARPALTNLCAPALDRGRPNNSGGIWPAQAGAFAVLL